MDFVLIANVNVKAPVIWALRKHFLKIAIQLLSGFEFGVDRVSCLFEISFVLLYVLHIYIFSLIFNISNDFYKYSIFCPFLEPYKYSYINKYRTYSDQIKYSMDGFHFLLIVVDMNTKLMGLLSGTKENWHFISILCGPFKKGRSEDFSEPCPVFTYYHVPVGERRWKRNNRSIEVPTE